MIPLFTFTPAQISRLEAVRAELREQIRATEIDSFSECRAVLERDAISALLGDYESELSLFQARQAFLAARSLETAAEYLALAAWVFELDTSSERLANPAITLDAVQTEVAPYFEPLIRAVLAEAPVVVQPREGMTVVLTDQGESAYSIDAGTRGVIVRVSSPDAQFAPATSVARITVRFSDPGETYLNIDWPTPKLAEAPAVDQAVVASGIPLCGCESEPHTCSEDDVTIAQETANADMLASLAEAPAPDECAALICGVEPAGAVIRDEGPQCTNCGRLLDSEGECRGGCSQDSETGTHKCDECGNTIYAEEQPHVGEDHDDMCSFNPQNAGTEQNHAGRTVAQMMTEIKVAPDAFPATMSQVDIMVAMGFDRSAARTVLHSMRDGMGAKKYASTGESQQEVRTHAEIRASLEAQIDAMTAPSITTLTEDGWLVTVVDRAPRAGERGWRVRPGFALDDALADVIKIHDKDGDNSGDFGWRSQPGDHTGCVTVIAEREDQLEVVLSDEIGLEFQDLVALDSEAFLDEIKDEIDRLHEIADDKQRRDAAQDLIDYLQLHHIDSYGGGS